LYVPPCSFFADILCVLTLKLAQHLTSSSCRACSWTGGTIRHWKTTGSSVDSFLFSHTGADGGFCVIQRKQVEVDEERFWLEILDTQSSDQFRAMEDLYLKNGQGFLIVFSITAKSTFDLEDIVERVLRIQDVEPGEVPFVICGNKADLEDQRVIETQEAQEFAERFGAAYFETSAKTNTRVDEAFYELVRRVHEKFTRKKSKAEIKAEEKRFRQQREADKRARKEQKAAQRALDRQATIDAATPKEIPDTVLPPLPAPAMPGEMRRLHERTLTGGDSERTCDIEFIFPPQGADAVGTTLRAHKVVVLGKGGALLRDSYVGSAKPDARGVTKVYMKPDGISLPAFRHLLSFVYSGQLGPQGEVDDDDRDDTVSTSTSLWGPWKPFASELETAAEAYDMSRLSAVIARGDDYNSSVLSDGACSLTVMLGADFLADVEFELSGDQSDDIDSARIVAVPAHQVVLRARSPYFERMFSLEQFAEGAQAAAATAPSSGEQRVKIPMDIGDCCEGALRRGLAFLYEENDASLENELILLTTGTGDDETDDDPSVVVMDLWRLARRWEVERLVLVVERVLVRSLTTESVCFFIQESLPSGASTGRPDLLASCIDFASYRLDSLSQVESFADLAGDVRDRLQAARKPGLWADPEAPGRQKLKKRLGLWKASLIS
jgi:Ras-related protein Rap-1A